MERVRVTQEQADAVDKYTDDLSRSHWQQKVNKLRSEVFIDKCLLDLSTDDFMHVFRHGYEVEETYDVGDWVAMKNVGDIGKVKTVDDNGVVADNEKGGSFNAFRHATPEEIEQEIERRWWEKHDRKPWSMRLYDCLISKNKMKPVVVIGINTNYFRGETTIELNDGTEILKEDLKKSFDVLYFAKDRKDV